LEEVDPDWPNLTQDKHVTIEFHAVSMLIGGALPDDGFYYS
jgi:hypothetical protein